MITEVLELDLSDALTSVDELGAALSSTFTTAAGELNNQLTAALDAVPALELEVDTNTAEQEIVAALEAGASVPIEPIVDDVSVTGSISSAIELGGETPIEFTDVDASSITDEIEAAIDDADTSVEIDGGEQLGKIGGEAGGATESISHLAAAVSVFDEVLKGSSGDQEAFLGFLDKIPAVGKEAAVGVGALGAAGDKFFHAALQTEAANERFVKVFGDLAPAVEKINFGGLNTTLDDLTLKLGANIDGVKLAAAKFGELGISSGRSREEAAKYAQQLVILAADLSATNPTLGSADQLIGRLSAGLARGGPAVARFGLSLTQAEIRAKVFEQTGNANVRTYTTFDKTAAGLAITLDGLKGKLAIDVARGAESSEVRIRAAGEALKRAFSDAGAQLIEPVLTAVEELTPSFVKLAHVVGVVLVEAIHLIGPPLKVFATVLDATLGEIEKLIGFIENADFISLLDELSPIDLGFQGVGKSAKGAKDDVKNLQDVLDEKIGDPFSELSGNATAKEIGFVVTALQNSEKAANDAKDALDRFLGKQLGPSEASAKAQGAIDDLTAAIKKTGSSLDLTNEKGRSTFDAFDKVVHTSKEEVDAFVAQGLIPAADANEALAQRFDQLAAKTNGPVREGFISAAAELRKFPANVGVDINAIDNVTPVLNKILRDAARTVFIHLETLFTPHASGGITHPGELSLVGEHGPELAVFPPGTEIIPADKTAHILGQGNVRDVIIHTQAQDPHTIARLAQRLILDETK